MQPTTPTIDFNGLIGQHKVKNKLEFFAQGKRSRGFIPAVLLNGAKGLGKTEFAKRFAKSLKRPMIELNCSTIKNEASFFEDLFMNFVLDKEVTILFDECHELPKKLMASFLTVFNPEGAKRKTLEWRENRLEFNFEKQTYLFATTEAHELFGPFKDRLNKVDFCEYSMSDLIGILQNKVDYISFKDDVLPEIGKTLRGNARSAVARATEIALYCDNKNRSSFGKNDWAELKNTLDLLPYGLTDVETQVLHVLDQRGASTLQMVAAATGMSRGAIQKEAEIHLLRNGLMKIDGKREITERGRQVVKEIA